MKIFHISDDKLIKIKEKSFDLEKDIQNVTEKNLETVFGLKFIRSEFSVQNFRIDTLAFDEQTKAFVIIEYKKGKNFSVFDQGMTYLSLMVSSKGEFINEYNENLDATLRKNDVDWTQSRIIFVSIGFNPYQLGALGFKDLPIELWQVKLFEKGTIVFNPIKPAFQSKVSIKTIKKGDESFDKVKKEIKVYTVEDHFKKEWAKSRELFEKLKEQIMGFYPATEKITKFYISYIDENIGKSFVEVVAQKQGIKLYFRPFVSQLKTFVKLNDCSKIGHWTNGNTFYTVTDETSLAFAYDLIKQTYDILQKENK